MSSKLADLQKGQKITPRSIVCHQCKCIAEKNKDIFCDMYPTYLVISKAALQIKNIVNLKTTLFIIIIRYHQSESDICRRLLYTLSTFLFVFLNNKHHIIECCSYDTRLLMNYNRKILLAEGYRKKAVRVVKYIFNLKLSQCKKVEFVRRNSFELIDKIL